MRFSAGLQKSRPDFRTPLDGSESSKALLSDELVESRKQFEQLVDELFFTLSVELERCF